MYSKLNCDFIILKAGLVRIIFVLSHIANV